MVGQGCRDFYSYCTRIHSALRLTAVGNITIFPFNVGICRKTPWKIKVVGIPAVIPLRLEYCLVPVGVRVHADPFLACSP